MFKFPSQGLKQVVLMVGIGALIWSALWLTIDVWIMAAQAYLQKIFLTPSGSDDTFPRIILDGSNGDAQFRGSVRIDQDLDIQPGRLADNTIVWADIMDWTIEGRDIKDWTITHYDVMDNSLIGADIRDWTIESRDIRDDSILGVDIRNETITSLDILNNTIKWEDIRDESITHYDILNNSILWADIRDGTIESRDIKDWAIGRNDLTSSVRSAIDRGWVTVTTCNSSNLGLKNSNWRTCTRRPYAVTNHTKCIEAHTDGVSRVAQSNTCRRKDEKCENGYLRKREHYNQCCCGRTTSRTQVSYLWWSRDYKFVR